MATRNGALALGLDGLAGTLQPGNTGSFLYLDLSAATKNQLLESIVHKTFTSDVRLIGAETADSKEEQPQQE
jgi:cytosine/adenosine deaminase-related metal-dependent hydrolase